MSSERAGAVEDAAPAAPGGAPAAAPPPGEVILEGTGIVKTYDMGDRGLQVLRGVSIEVRKGEILAIQGPSGAGKSTLLHVLGLLDEPDEGVVRWKGENVLARSAYERARYRNENIGFVFQFYHLFPDLTALENVCLPKMVGLGTLDYRSAEASVRAKAEGLLSLVGLEERATHLPNELSGGERQRVAIARALMNDPEVVLCDEPTGNLDQKTSGEILDLLWRLNAETGRTFVIVTHDVGLARRAHRSVSVIDGVLAPTGTPVKPRGFAETRFRLRKPGLLYDWKLHPALAFVLVPLVPFGPFLWLFFVHQRFSQATRRGRSGWAAAFAYLVPILNVFWPFTVHFAPLATANRILAANGEAQIGRATPYLASFLYGATQIGAVALGWSALSQEVRGADTIQALAGVVILLYLGTIAWIQSLFNAFFDRMAPRAPGG